MPLCRRVLLVLLCHFALLPQARAAEVRGKVFLDRNENGRLDPEEPGLSDCLVSDGAKLVRTDGEGKYVLAGIENTTNVFVVNPPGTWPSGPWWSFVGESATEQTSDFALRQVEQPQPFYFVQGTDMHVQERAMPLYREYVAHVNQLPVPVAFAAHTGDLVVDALRTTPDEAAALFDIYEEATADLRIPVRNVIGNHEHVALQRDDHQEDPDRGKGMYRRRFGPTSYAFRYGPYHFLALDGTTIDTAARMGYRDGLDDKSSAWAVEYLGTLQDGELVILLIHQPMGQSPAVQRLLAALKGKRLLLTLWGHGHNRTVSQFGGAPSIMGGAVSYAWHGFVPYPPNPRGYVLCRVEGDTVDHIFLDWAYERSIEVVSPAWEEPVRGRISLEGQISDLDSTLQNLTCRIAERQSKAELKPPGPMAKAFRIPLDLEGLADGVYDLTFAAADNRATEEQSRPILVLNGSVQSYQAAGPAKLRLRVDNARKSGGEVLVNGRTTGRRRNFPSRSIRRLCGA